MGRFVLYIFVVLLTVIGGDHHASAHKVTPKIMVSYEIHLQLL
jgi:hypothetical protein